MDFKLFLIALILAAFIDIFFDYQDRKKKLFYPNWKAITYRDYEAFLFRFVFCLLVLTSFGFLFSFALCALEKAYEMRYPEATAYIHSTHGIIKFLFYLIAIFTFKRFILKSFTRYKT